MVINFRILKFILIVIYVSSINRPSTFTATQLPPDILNRMTKENPAAAIGKLI
jgi:hypothetical protein